MNAGLGAFVVGWGIFGIIVYGRRLGVDRLRAMAKVQQAYDLHVHHTETDLEVIIRRFQGIYWTGLSTSIVVLVIGIIAVFNALI